MRKEIRLLSTEDAKKATPIGMPVLLDDRLTNGRRVFHRAGAREIDPRANALSYAMGVRGTSGVVVQFYVAPVSLQGKPMTVEPDLTKYDVAQLPILRNYR